MHIRNGVARYKELASSASIHTHNMVTHPLPMHLVHSSKNRVTFTTSLAWTMIDLLADFSVGRRSLLHGASSRRCGADFVDRNGHNRTTGQQDTYSDNCQSRITGQTGQNHGQIDQTFTRSNSHSFVRQRSFSFYVRSDFAPLLLGTYSDIISKYRIQTDM